AEGVRGATPGLALGGAAPFAFGAGNVPGGNTPGTAGTGAVASAPGGGVPGAGSPVAAAASGCTVSCSPSSSGSSAASEPDSGGATIGARAGDMPPAPPMPVDFAVEEPVMSRVCTDAPVASAMSA